MLSIIHNTKCSKSRAALEFLKNSGLNFEIRNLHESPLSPTEIKEILEKLNQNVHDLIRKNESLFVERFEKQEKTDSEWMEVLSENPNLLQRPIVINGNKAVIARPLENIHRIL